MKRSVGSVGRAADNVTNSSAARPAQPSAITWLHMSADAFTKCLSTHSVDAFFQQCSATELTAPEIDLLNLLFSVAEMIQALLPPSVSLQEWAHRRVPRGFERQVNSSGMVYVSDRQLQYVPQPSSEPRSASSAAQPTSDSSAAQPASAVEELGREAFFQQCSGSELTGPEMDLLNSLMRVSEVLQAVLPRSVTLQEWVHRISSAGQPALDSSAAEPAAEVEQQVLDDSNDSLKDLSDVPHASHHMRNSVAQHTGSSAAVAKSSAQQPADCHSTNVADNNEHHFAIYDDSDNGMDEEPDEWHIYIQQWHRYNDPEYEDDWFSCVAKPELWCYENEVVLDEQGYFRFQGQWNQVVTPEE